MSPEKSNSLDTGSHNNLLELSPIAHFTVAALRLAVRLYD